MAAKKGFTTIKKTQTFFYGEKRLGFIFCNFTRIIAYFTSNFLLDKMFARSLGEIHYVLNIFNLMI